MKLNKLKKEYPPQRERESMYVVVINQTDCSARSKLVSKLVDQLNDNSWNLQMPLNSKLDIQTK
jgi:hypothetical protein